MVIEQDLDEMLRCQKMAESFYNRFRDNLISMNIPFSGEPLPNGSPPHVSAGATLLPSRTEMHDLGALISLVLNYWVQYGQLPTVEQLRSSAESMESDSVGFTTTLYSVVHLGAFLTCICAGDLGKATSVLNLSTQEEEQPTTSPSTFSRTRVPIQTGQSTTPVTDPPPLPTKPPAEKAGTSAGSSGDPKKVISPARSRKPNPRKKKRKKAPK